jgi:predicted acylesterase/phospholipase RssA
MLNYSHTIGRGLMILGLTLLTATASASIPGVFPPVYIPVQGPDGETYREMHVDGGTSAQVFLYPSRTNWAELMNALDVQGTPVAYLIRNSRIDAEYELVRPRLLDIVARSVASLIRTRGIGDIYRVAATTQRDGVDLEATWIPARAIRNPGEEVFDPEYMAALFDFGYLRTTSGATWTRIDISELVRAND